MSRGRRSNLPWVVLVVVLIFAAGGLHGHGGLQALTSSGGSAPAAVPPSSAAIAAEQSYAQQLFGNDSSQQTCLVDLWNQESGWNADAVNTQSGADGVAQALGHGGSNTAAPNGVNEYGPLNGMTLTTADYQAANAGDARAQIRWGRQYINLTYGSPCAAWQHEVANNWY